MYYFQQGPQNPPRCECHECTQARWKSTLGGQMQAAQQKPYPLDTTSPAPTQQANKEEA